MTAHVRRGTMREGARRTIGAAPCATGGLRVRVQLRDRRLLAALTGVLVMSATASDGSGPDPWWRHGRDSLPSADPRRTEPRAPLWITGTAWRSNATVFGRFDIGWGRPLDDGRVPASACPDPPGIRSAARNQLGLRATEPLALGWQASVMLLNEFNADTGASGCSAADEQITRWGRQASVALSHRHWGSVQLGWRDPAARLVALAADPWGGHGVASPIASTFAVAQPLANKVGRSVTLGWSDDDRLRVELQAAVADESVPASRGAAVAGRAGSWHYGAGWHRWEDGDWLAPLALGWEGDRAHLHAVFTSGRHEGARAHNAFLGVRLRPDFPQRNEWRLGLNRHRSDAPGRSATQFSAGYWRPFWAAPNTALYANVTLRKADGESARSGAEFGLRYTFARDLRWP
jgi:predicted porin